MKPINYILIIPNERVKTYRYITLFALLLNCLAFGLIFFNTANVGIKNLSRLGSAFSLIWLLLYFIKYQFRRLSWFRITGAFTVLSIFWLLLGNYLLAMLLLVLEIFGVYTNREFRVIFSGDKIVYPSFPEKIFLWEDVSNVILKDNVLTIDLKNNKLIQAVITKGSAEDINEAEFNSFCRSRLGNPAII